MRILCIGFYGHGNAGDEAVARCLDRYLRAPFENVKLDFSTEISNAEAALVNENNKFYKERRLISVYDLETIKEPDIVLVGGGDLSAFYGMQQVVMARESSRARMIARVGTSAKDDFLQGGKKTVDMVRHMLLAFDHVSVRDKTSADVLQSLGVRCHVGADLAMDMLDDRNVEVPEKPYVVLVVREVRNDDAERQLKIAKRVFVVLEQEIGNVVLLPFCGADERFSERLAELCKVRSLASGLWQNPGGLQWVIANSAYVVSLGRLHPLVFAVGSRRPCCAVTYPWLTGYDKINAFMNHCGLGHRVMDWGVGVGEIGARVQDAVQSRAADNQIVEAYSGHLKGLALEALCPVWGAMGVEHGLGLERGMKWSDFRPDEYDDTYYFGARIFKKGEEFAVYHPSRGDWAEWDVIRDLVIKHTNPKSLIDVGCARGWFLKRMIDAGVTAHGVDMSAAAWAEPAPGMQEHIKVGLVSDVAHRRYDVATVFDVMEHIYLDDLNDAISAIKSAAGKYIVLNICAARDGEPVFTIKKGEPISPELEWLAVSGHVTIRHRDWWRKRFEDDDWESDEAMVDAWLEDKRLRYPSWERHNLLILRRRAAA